MNILTYTLQLNDKMSSTLNKIGASTDSTTQDVRELKGEVSNLNKINLGGFFSSIGKIATVLGVGTVLGKSIKLGMEQEMRNTSFEVLFGGVDNAKRMIDDISGYAAKSPYGKVGLSEATQVMAGFGIAQDKIMPNLKAIGDIAMGNEQKFQSLTLAFSQMSSTGKLTGQDLLQMINAGFNPLDQISKTTGKSISFLKDQMAKGVISSDMVTKAFHDATKEGGLYYGMIDKINNTVGGQWATAMDSISEKMLNFYSNVLQPLILPALKTFNQFLEDPIGTIGRLVDKVTTGFPVISGAIIAITAGIGGYLLVTKSSAIVTAAATAVTKIWTAAQWLLNAALNANPVGLIVAGVVALIGVITFLVVKLDGWRETWDNLMKFCSLVFDSFKTNLQLKWMQIQDFFMSGLEIIEKGWYKLQSLWNKEAAGAGLTKLEAQRNERAQEIAATQKKIAELNSQIANLDVIQLKMNDTTFSDVTGKLKNKLGISVPGIPGTGTGITGTKGLLDGGSGTGIGAGKDTANSIATGGTKTTHISISIGEMGNNMQVFADNVRDGAANIRDLILDELTRALAMAQGQA